MTKRQFKCEKWPATSLRQRLLDCVFFLRLHDVIDDRERDVMLALVEQELIVDEAWETIHDSWKRKKE